MLKSIEITIPILNEETTLLAQAKIAIEYINNNLHDLGQISLVLADNGSNDRTQQIAEKLAAEHPSIKYLRLEERGVGRALKASWSKSSADIVGYMDLDFATDLMHLRETFEILLADEADIVTGSRLAKGAKVIGRAPLRSFASRVFNRLVQLLFKTSFSDGMCGFKFLKRNLLTDLMKAGAQSDGWFFATEFLVSGDHLKYRIIDLPVVWTDDPNSKVKIVKLTIEYLRAMWVLRKKLSLQPKRITGD